MAFMTIFSIIVEIIIDITKRLIAVLFQKELC